MKTQIKKTLAYAIFTLVIFVACMLFWLYGHPELLSYHEQYQLFLFTGDYFTERISVVGGLADYISEFIVQFYYVPWIGAACIAAVMAAIQWLTACCCFSALRDKQASVLFYALSALPSVLLTYFMGDINLLMSYPVAVMLTLAVTLLTLKIKIRGGGILAVVVMSVYVALYWCVGPVALLYPLIIAIQTDTLKKRWLWAVGAVVLSLLVIFAINRLFFTQYPETQLFYGINYSRITNHHPAAVFIIAALIVLLTLIVQIFNSLKRVSAGLLSGGIAMCAVLVFAVVFVPSGYDDNEAEVLRYDMLVRNEKWHDIIDLAEKSAPTNDFCLQGLNLALAKTGQLGDRMFEFDQHGIGSLISKYKNDNTTCLISAEVFYHLGMINSAFRYNFDTQESIMNDRKSGRFMKRMAECLIINHKYKAASKYINKLKHSLYYSDWAKRAEAYYLHEDRTDMVPAWAEKRQLRFKQEMLYDYAEIDRMFGLLALGSQGRNLLAWDYFIAALMLKGDLQTLTGVYHFANEDFNLTSIPKHHQQAIGLYWTFGHQSFDGLPFPISDGVKQEIANLAQVYSQNMNRPEVWQQRFKDNYCTYFLSSMKSPERAK